MQYTSKQLLSQWYALQSVLAECERLRGGINESASGGEHHEESEVHSPHTASLLKAKTRKLGECSPTPEVEESPKQDPNKEQEQDKSKTANASRDNKSKSSASQAKATKQNADQSGKANTEQAKAKAKAKTPKVDQPKKPDTQTQE